MKDEVLESYLTNKDRFNTLWFVNESALNVRLPTYNAAIIVSYVQKTSK